MRCQRHNFRIFSSLSLIVVFFFKQINYQGFNHTLSYNCCRKIFVFDMIDLLHKCNCSDIVIFLSLLSACRTSRASKNREKYFFCPFHPFSNFPKIELNFSVPTKSFLQAQKLNLPYENYYLVWHKKFRTAHRLNVLMHGHYN